MTHSDDSSDGEIPVPMKLSAYTKALLNGSGDRGSSLAANGKPPRLPSPESPIVPQPRTRRGSRGSIAAASQQTASSRTTRSSTRVSTTASHQPTTRSGRTYGVSASGTKHESSSHSISVTRTKRDTGKDLPSSRAPSPLNPASASKSTSANGIAVITRTRRDTNKDLSSLRSQSPVNLSSSNHKSSTSSSSSNAVARPQHDANEGLPSSRPPSPIHPALHSPSGFASQPRQSSQGSGQEAPSRVPSPVNTPPVPVRTVRISGNSSQHSAKKASSSERAPAVAPQGSMRLKRVTPGSFLSGPARRGFRRQSEEEAVAQGEGSPVSIKEPVRAVLRQLASTPGSQHRKLDFSNHALQEKENNPLGENKPFGVSANVRRALQFSDENVDIDAVISSVRAGEKASEFSDAKIDMAKILADVRRAAAEKEAAEKAAAERAAAEKAAAERAAAERASPPPKMTVVETATAAAGASAAAQAMKKKQILLRVNNRAYAKIDCIGRGGSGKVYRVSAESGKMLALKRVPLELADERTVENYKGEIDLLKRLQGVDRVIQLIDYELNIDKKVLSMVMEIGELDFQTFLRSRQGSPEGERMDPVFVRNWWKEMVECVRAVHRKDIVHSDLKPANFVIVQGRLKLIDFGIANALQTDMTVNVHREHQIGTPNYMSPESLLDSHMYSLLAENHGNLAAALPQAQDHIKNRGRLMKLGKPSDVWSLGCILYQMVYGHPPFGKIKSQPARCQAIISWAHEIDFSEKTEHGVRVPPSLIRTMRRCLNREQKERPTCDELLAETDPFLYPREFDAGVYAGAEQGLVLPVTEEVLGQIIQSVVRRCKAKMPSMEEVESVWGKAYFSALKNMH